VLSFSQYEALKYSFYFLFNRYIIVQIESHVKRLDEDLGQFAEDLKQGISNSRQILLII
jgi:hypothetical protein